VNREGDESVKRSLAHFLATALVFVVAAVSAASESAWQEPIDVAFRAQYDGSTQRYVLLVPAGLDEVKQKYRVRHTFVCGGSMGASAALTFAVLHPDRVDGVVALNGTANHVEYTGFQEAIGESFGGTKEEVPHEYRRRSAELFPERLTMPMAATVGGRDAAVPPESVRRLFSLLEDQGRPVLLIDRPEGGHATDYDDTTAAIRFVVEKVREKSEQRASARPVKDLDEAVAWLERESRRMIRACRREMDDGTAAFPPQVGIGYNAFWATATGWFVYTLDLVDPELADRTILDLVSDFQQRGCLEWCFGDLAQRPDYLASGTMPLAGIRRVIRRREK
jgi:dienelactone hydrolase